MFVHQSPFSIMEFTKTTHNKNKVLHEGFSYVKKNNLADGWESFECERRRRYKDCSGSIKVKNGQFRNGNPHSHTPNPGLNEAYKVMTVIRDQAQQTLNQPQQILGNAMTGVTDSVAAELLSIPTIRRNIRRQRKEADNAVPVPVMRATLPNPIPQEFTTTNAASHHDND